MPPIISRYFFTHTSAWILFLAVLAFEEMKLFAVLLGCSSVASALHWNNFKSNSMFFQFDKCFAWSIFGYVYLRGEGVLLWSFLLIVAFCFFQGRQAFLLQKWLWHFVWHAAFRFFAFWAVCIFMRHTDPFFVAVWNLLYLSHSMWSFWMLVEQGVEMNTDT